VFVFVILSIQELKMCGDMVSRAEENPQNYNARHLNATINQSTSFFEVAAFTSDNMRGNRHLEYRLDKKSYLADGRDMRVEPLVYPLLFWHGEDGWNWEKGKSLRYMKYLRARQLIPEWEEEVNGFGRTFNRFQLLSRAGQYYAVECIARAQDYRLNWHRGEGKNTIFGYKNTTSAAEVGHDSDNAVDKDREVFNDSCKTFLNDSFAGSPRHLKKLAVNTLILASEMGGGTFFITLTCNPKWKEIVEALLPTQTAFDRPDLTVQVFKYKLAALLHNLRGGKYTGGMKTSYLIYVIEYQHRGLPHAHIVCQVPHCDVS